MKSIKCVSYLSLIFGSVAALFAPYLRLNDVYYSILKIPQLFEVNGLFALFFVAFGIYFAGTCLLFIVDKNKWIAPSVFVLVISASILFSLTKTITKESVSYSSMAIAASPVVMSLLSLGSAIYASILIFDKSKISVRDMAEIAIFVSFAFMLDLPLFKLKVVANGGSISLIMIPLIILSLRKGFFKGFIGAGIVFGLVSCFADGYGLITFPLDYLLGFGAMAIVGIFRRLIVGKEKVSFLQYVYLLVAVSIAMVVRTLASTLSGIWIYGLDFYSSLVYQLTYMGPSFIVCIVVLIILLYPLNKLSLKKA